MNRMKVAFLTYGTSPVPATRGGAVENLIEDLFDENEKRGLFDFSVLTIYEKDAAQKAKEYKRSDFNFVKCPGLIDILDKSIYWIAKYILKKDKLISYRFIIRRLYVMSKYPRILLENNYDRIVLVTNSTLFFVLKNKKVAKKYENKVVYYLHNEVRSLFKCEKEVASIRTLIGISQFVNNSFRKKVPTLKNEQCFVLKNGIDIDKFLNKKAEKIDFYKKKYGITENDFVVIFAGRLVDEKGALETIQAIKACKDQSIKLLIVGSGFYSSDVVDNYTKKLQQEATEIKNQIIFTGYIDYDDMPSIYHLGNIAVLPSMWDEPAGMTMVEAVVSGLPLITTNSGGIPEYISSSAAIILNRDDMLVSNIKKNIKLLKQSSEKKICFDMSNDLSLKSYYLNFAKILYEKDAIEI